MHGDRRATGVAHDPSSMTWNSAATLASSASKPHEALDFDPAAARTPK